jgi:hypothetical protein
MAEEHKRSSAGNAGAVEELAEFLCNEYEGEDASFFEASEYFKERWRAAVRAMLARVPNEPQPSADSASLLAEADGVLSVGNAMDMSISGAWAFIKKARDFLALTEPQPSAGSDPLKGLDERLDRLFLTADDGNRFVLSTESAKNIVGIVREWLRTRAEPQGARLTGATDLTPLADRWPLGCHSPNSCSRNSRCMYVGCKHDGKDIGALASAVTRPEGK